MPIQSPDGPSSAAASIGEYAAASSSSSNYPPSPKGHRDTESSSAYLPDEQLWPASAASSSSTNQPLIPKVHDDTESSSVYPPDEQLSAPLAMPVILQHTPRYYEFINHVTPLFQQNQLPGYSMKRDSDGLNHPHKAVALAKEKIAAVTASPEAAMSAAKDAAGLLPIVGTALDLFNASISGKSAITASEIEHNQASGSHTVRYLAGLEASHHAKGAATSGLGALGSAVGVPLGPIASTVNAVVDPSADKAAQARRDGHIPTLIEHDPDARRAALKYFAAEPRADGSAGDAAGAARETERVALQSALGKEQLFRLAK